jgi:hypothetical protein
MSTTTPSLNGRMKKTLSFQLDRLDTILDGLAEALNGAVAEAVKEAVGPAAREAVKVALNEAMAQAAVEKPQREVEKAPAAPSAVVGFWSKAKAMLSNVISQVKNMAVAAYQQVQQFGARILCGTLLAVQSVVATARSRALRWSMMIGALTSCVVSLYRRESRVFWWSAAIGFCVILLESYLGTLGTLMLGGGLIYFTAHQQNLADQQRGELQVDR